MMYRHILESKKNTGSRVVFKNIFWLPFLICLTSALGGCAILSAKSDQKAGQGIRMSPSVESDMVWQRTAFKIKWPEKSEPLWYMDLLIAHKIIGPVLDAHHNQIALWRFHRRAGNDAAGHQFSFIFYTTGQAAAVINREIASNSLLASLKASGKIENLYLQDVNQPRQSTVEATSDPHWSLPLQKAWPYYIMGSSQMWLSLIDQYARELEGTNTLDLKKMDDFYQSLNARMNLTWQDEGRHALLHHLNALFGYRPLLLKFQF